MGSPQQRRNNGNRMSFVKSLAQLRRRKPLQRAEWLIVGLGNPGAQYARTRHNIGFMCLNRIAHREHVRFHGSGRDRADIAEAVVGRAPALLAQPQTYMNESGAAVARLLKRLDLGKDRLLVIYDDVDLPFGSIRIRSEGSAGGHRGMADIVDHLHTTTISRIRVGIGRGPQGVKDFVLGEFDPEERRIVPEICDSVASMAGVVVAEGVVAAMNQFNGREPVAASRTTEA